MSSTSYKPKSTWRKSTSPYKTTTSPHHHITKSPKRRGALSPLLTEDQKAKASIHELSYDFSCRVTRLYQYLTEDAEYKEFVSIKQLYRSGTSIGANTREAQHAQSTADFLSKLSIAYKEADESDFWINLLHDNGYINDIQFNSLNSDVKRIIKLLTSITKKTKEKIRDTHR